MVIVSCALSAMSEARDVSWRLGTPHNLWEPAMWDTTSGLVTIALLPLAQLAAALIRASVGRLVVLGLAGAVCLVFVYSALHVVGMGLLREFVYRLAGWPYSFPWASQFPYEMRKDLLGFSGLVIIFWLADHVVIVSGEKTGKKPDITERATPPREFWLRDGRISILVDPSDIIAVTSAGNYVEYRLLGDRTHLIRTTLQAQEDRLAPFGIVRVHRTRLVNLDRIVALEWRQSGDFELRLDTGETVSCSRRFKAAVANIAG